MKVALYYPWIYLTSGAERVLLQLTGRSRHEWTLFTNHFDAANTFPEFGERNVVELSRVPVKRSIGQVFRAARNIFWQRLPLEDYDALVVVCEGLGDLTVLRNRSIPAINVCLTPLRIVFDDAYRQSWLASQGMAARLAVTCGSWIFRAIDRAAWRRYRRVFFISRESSNRARDGNLGRPETQEILYPGVGLEPDAPGTVFDRFFFVPGRIMWTKNLELAMEAFRLFRAKSHAFADFRLVIAGMVDRKSEAYYQHLRAKAADVPGVEFHIHPSDAELTAYYRNCYGMLFTAFNEDWGIVPIEAMAFGKPVICVNRGGPRESVQNGVQGFLEEPDPEQFASRMAQLVENPELASRMGAAGPARARLFSWEVFVNKIDLALDEIAGQTAKAPEALAAAASDESEILVTGRELK